VAEEHELADVQRAHWQSTYSTHPGLHDENPSAPSVHAVGVFRTANATDVLELDRPAYALRLSAAARITRPDAPWHFAAH
jgi:hypothetical protein